MNNEHIVYRFTKAFTEMNTPQSLDLIRRRMIAFDNNNLDAIRANEEMIRVGYLVPAAIVKCSVHKLFDLTNTIDNHWSENEEVTITNPDCRLSSSTMGDVFVDPLGQMWMYTMSGMTIMRDS